MEQSLPVSRRSVVEVFLRRCPAVGAAGPAAGAAFPGEHFLLKAGKMLVAGDLSLGRGHPADPFVPGEISEIVPLRLERGILRENVAESAGYIVPEVGVRFCHRLRRP